MAGKTGCSQSFIVSIQVKDVFVLGCCEALVKTAHQVKPKCTISAFKLHSMATLDRPVEQHYYPASLE